MGAEEIRTVENKKESPLTGAEEFARDILKGLSGKPKTLPSKYLYDPRGDKIFQQIMDLPEYYLTRCEEQVLQSSRAALLEILVKRSRQFTMVELGAGDGKKTKILLEHFLKNGAGFSYMPVDISQHALDDLGNSLRNEFPSLSVRPVAKDYIRALHDIAEEDQNLRFVLFLGGNIGNFTKEEARSFLALLNSKLYPGDLLLTGFDLMKDPSVIYHAYNDTLGVTRSFNFNLLRRINKELDGDFDADKFVHYPTYDPLSGAMKSFLISEEPQTVTLKRPGAVVQFEAWEPIFIEVSNKYSLAEIDSMAQSAGFRIINKFFDKKKYYSDVLFEKL